MATARERKAAASAMGYTETAIGFALELKWPQLPAEVRHQARRCLLDALGVLIAGTRTEPASIMARIALAQFGGDQATILVGGERASAAGAVLANGFAANALDMDDGYRLVKGHPGACVLPVILAAAEMAPSCTGEDFLTALVLGYELGIRAGRIRHALCHTYHSSGSWGAISGAAAAGRILGLDARTLGQAMGVAEYHAPIAPMMKGIAVPSMGKDSIGWGAMVAILSVLMSSEGFTGIEPLFADCPDPDWIHGLGRDWEILGLYFKPYAACRWAHPAVAGVLKIVRAQGFAPADIESIHIRTFGAACAMSCRAPGNTEEAQYSLAYPVAAAVADGVVGPEQVLPPRIFDPDLVDLMKRITTEIVPGYETRFPAQTLGDVTVTVGGERFFSGTVGPPWEPPDTLPGDSALEDKFCRLVAPVLGRGSCQELVSMIWRFHELPRASDLVRCCRAQAG